MPRLDYLKRSVLQLYLRVTKSNTQNEIMVTFETLNQFISAHKIIAVKITLCSCQARSPIYCAEGLFAVLQLQRGLNCTLKLCIHLFHTVPSASCIKV